jgi:hypothetical protein
MKVVAIALMLGVAAPALSAPPPSKCDFKRAVALGKFTASIYKGIFKDGSASQKVVDKLLLKWVKAAKKGDCTPGAFSSTLGTCEQNDIYQELMALLEAASGQGPSCTAP